MNVRRSRSCKVTDFGTNRKLVYDFLLVINTKIHPCFLRQKCSSKYVVSSAISFMAIFAEITENKCVMRMRSHMSCWILKYYLLSIIFKFNCLQIWFLHDEIFVNFRLRHGIIFLLCVVKILRSLSDLLMSIAYVMRPESYQIRWNDAK